MKSLRIFVLLLLFLHSKTGLAVNLHFCGDHLANISWAFNAQGCGMESPVQQNTDGDSIAKAHCCKDNTLIAQDQSPQTSKSLGEDAVEKITLEIPRFQSPVQNQLQQSVPSILTAEPPPDQKRYKRFCQFIFYG